MDELEEVISLLQEMGMSELEATQWLYSPQEALFGSTGVEIILAGEGASLVEYLAIRAGRLSGPLY
jgi:hypothetical protein